jgi:hypothetical protein
MFTKNKGVSIVKKILISIFMILIITSCQNQNSTEHISRVSSQESKIEYSLEKAKKNGDVIDIHGEVFNLEKLEKFISNVNDKKKSKIRITRYTIEGDPIFYNIDFDGKIIHFTIDNTMDKYSEIEKGKNTIICSSIKKEESSEKVRYVLDDCEKKKVDILSVSKKKT